MIIYNKKDKVGLFWYIREKNELSKKIKNEFRSEDRSYIARPKRGYLPCQFVTKMLAISLCIDIKYSRCSYSNVILH